MITLGKLKINGAVLAPMAGFTDSAFRQVCTEAGAGLVFTEMVSAKAMCYGDKKTASLLSFTQSERPLAIQLFGSEPDTMAAASEMLCTLGPDLIDINMGCPVPKIVSGGSGSALLKNPKLAFDIVSAISARISMPLSVKIRIGWDSEHICTPDFAKGLADSGASLITVHGRTREQMYCPGINMQAIADVKAAVSVPVIANGDISSFDDADSMIKSTGCDSVMIGRAALGNPYIFSELIRRDKYIQPGFSERMKNLIYLTDLEIKKKGEHLAMLELRRHLPFFFKAKRGAAEIRRQCCCVESRKELIEIIKNAVKMQSKEEKTNEV